MKKRLRSKRYTIVQTDPGIYLVTDAYDRPREYFPGRPTPISDESNISDETDVETT